MILGVESFLRDFAYALRVLRRKPGFTAIAILTLGLGIGINTAVFSVIDAVLLRPLPYRQPESLALIWSNFQKMGASRAPASGVMLREIQNGSRLLKDVAGIWAGNGTITGNGDPEQVKVGWVTSNFMTVLGARPALGRVFQPSEEGFGARRAVILSDGLWRRRFGGDPHIQGQTLRLDGTAFTIVGIMPRDFRLLVPPDANIPASADIFAAFPYDIGAAPADLYYLRLLARLKDGATLDQARQDVDSMARRLRENHPEFRSENLRLDLVPLHHDAVREVRPVLLALFVGAGLVLLIACVNVANLLLTAASGRRTEIAVRASLGASRSRVARQLIAENLVLGLSGGVLGLSLGWIGVPLLLRLRPESLIQLEPAGLNPSILGFTVVACLISTIIFGLTPGIEATRLDLAATLREASRGAGARTRRGSRAVLITCEIALACILLIGTGLMIRTLVSLQRSNPGFDARGVLTFEIAPAGAGYQTDVRRASLVNEFESRLAALPGVEAVGGISHLPLDDYPNWYSPFAPEGVTSAESRNLLADYRAVTPGYFRAMGATLVAGRHFSAMDTASSQAVAIVDELLARTVWPHQSAIGKRITAEHFLNGNFDPRVVVIAGVVRHIRHHSLTRAVRGQIYLPYAQNAREHLSFAVRSSGDPLALAGPVRRELAALDKDLAISKVRPMSEYVATASAPARFTALLASMFGGLALVLASVGLYGVISYSVATRIQELGIRMAVGARPADILALVIREGLAFTGAGLLLGVAGAIPLARRLDALLYGVTPFDPIAWGVVLSVMPAVAFIACLQPARRAAAGSPLDAMRGR